MSAGLWISEAEVVSLISLPEAIEALRAGLREQAGGRAWNMVKTHTEWAGGSTLHAIGAVFEGRGIVGTKTWAHAPGGATPLLILIDSCSGAVLAIIEAFALGQMRTGGISGLASDLLASPETRTMAMIGAGKQSLPQIAAVAAVRRLDEVRVWSPTAANREALAARTMEQLQISARATASLEEAIDGAQVVTLATRARAPFLARDVLARGTHINAVGAIELGRIEFEPSLLERATVCAADSVEQVRRLSREFTDAFGDREEQWSRLKPLCDLVVQNASRSPETDLTVFKAMGMGISDLSLGIAIVERARATGLGRPLPEIKRQAPRLR